MEESQKKIGGWLFLTVIGFIANIYYLGMTILNQVSKIEPNYVLICLASSYIIIIFYLVKIFFQRKIVFPKYYISFFLFLIMIGFLYLLLVAIQYSKPPENELNLVNYTLMQKDAKDDAHLVMLQSLLNAFIWIPYYMKSKRVKLTFVN